MRALLFLVLLLSLTGLGGLAAPARAEFSMTQLRAIYRSHGVTLRPVRTDTIDAATLAQIEPALRSAPGKTAQGVLTALRGPLAGARVHVLAYGNSGYRADILEQDGQVRLASFFLPIVTTTGAPPPKGYVEATMDVATRLTDGARPDGNGPGLLQSAIDEAHAYSRKSSTRPHPGVVTAQGKSWSLSARALVPDYIVLTVTRFPGCPYRPGGRGWLMEHVCEKAR